MASDDIASAFTDLGGRGLVGRMHEQLDELLAARDQMELLLRVVMEISSDLDLDATLHRIIAAAMRLTGARYGALGVWGADGRLASFLHDGIDSHTVKRIGHLPVGKGVLGLLADSSEPLRLDDLTEHPAAVGFPEHHPPMRAFLGVPITIRGAVFGSLYVADDRPQRTFSGSHEIAVRALASAAGVAVDNAQLFERLETSARWTTASRQITTTLLSGDELHAQPLQLIVDRARELTDAEQAIILVPTDPEQRAEDVTALVVSAAVGLHTKEVIGQRVPVDESTTGAVFRSGEPVITDIFRHPIEGFTDVGQRPAIVVPLRAHGEVIGVIAVARNAYQPPFTGEYLDLMRDFADHAAMALTLAQAREHARELSILADRERIAHDLHDHVIQKLFAAGMDLQGTIARAHSPQVVSRLNRTVDEMQATIDDIRAVIFRLNFPHGAEVGFEQRIRSTVRTLTENIDITTTLQISGPMTAIPAELAEHGEAVVTEALSNAIRHSGARNLTVEIAVADQLTVEVTDNGRGIDPANTRRSGLANMARRAQQLSGTCHISAPPTGGTRLHWSAPLIDE